MIRQSLVERLASSTERLQAALVAGESTTPHRTAIARLEADLIKLDADALRAESAAIANTANDQGKLAASLAESAGAGIAACLAMHPLPIYQPLPSDTMTSPAITSATRALAAEEIKYEKAAQLYGESTIRTGAIQSRLSDIENAGLEIREQRHSGQLTDREAAGLIALNLEDAADLRKLLTAAMIAQELLVPSEASLRYAQGAFAHAVKVASFDALTQRAKEAEQSFLAIVADVYAAGRSIGRSSMLGSSWIPTKELGYMITSGQPPGARNA